jgi:hypothetical protein
MTLRQMSSVGLVQELMQWLDRETRKKSDAAEIDAHEAAKAGPIYLLFDECDRDHPDPPGAGSTVGGNETTRAGCVTPDGTPDRSE